MSAFRVSHINSNVMCSDVLSSRCCVKSEFISYCIVIQKGACGSVVDLDSYSLAFRI